MNVILSTGLARNYNEFTIIDKASEVMKLGSIDCFILHSYKEGDVPMAGFIRELKKQYNCPIFYINANPKTFAVMLIEAADGIVIEDDFYYDNEEDLLALINPKEEYSTALTVSSSSEALSIVRDFIMAYTRGESRCSAPYFIQQTSEALNELEGQLCKSELQLKNMSTTATDVVERASTFIGKLQEQIKIQSKQIEELGKGSASSGRRALGEGGASFYPTVRYNPPPIKQVLVVREVSPCKYLTSFMLSYQSYLRTMRNKRVKLVFCVGRGRGILQKYESDLFTFISQESMNNSSIYSRDIIVTNSPMNNVMIKIMESGTYDIILVVDRLYGANVVLDGANIKHLNAISGSTDIKRYHLPAASCICSTIDMPNTFGCIPTLKGYPPASQEDLRAQRYVQLCRNPQVRLYDKVDNFLGINGN